ncbi:hypothetical protein Tco_0675093 [Tanacetum coccineum]
MKPTTCHALTDYKTKNQWMLYHNRITKSLVNTCKPQHDDHKCKTKARNPNLGFIDFGLNEKEYEKSILNFLVAENSSKRLPSVDEMRGLPSFESGFGKGQVVLDFENSTVRLPSAERDIRKSAVFNDGIWFGLNVLTGSYRDDPYNCFFRQSGSVETQDAVYRNHRNHNGEMELEWRCLMVKMDDPNITMEEYIRLEEEKARRRGKVYNWETTTICPLNYNKIDFRISFDESDDEDYTVIYDKNSFSYKIISVNDLKTDSENDNDKFNMPSFPSPEPTVSYFDDLDFFKDFENEFTAIVYNDALTSKLDFLTEPSVSPQHIDEFDLKDETSLSECDEEEQNVLCFNDLFPFNIIYPDDSKSDKDNDDDKIDIKHSSGGNVMNTDDGAYAQSTADAAYSLNEYSVFDTGINTAYPGDLVKEISTNIGGEFTNLEILKCWSLETSSRLFNTLNMENLPSKYQGSNNQVKDNKIDLLVKQYEQFIISEDESIDSVFARFNTTITSLKALDEGYSSNNYVRKFLRALHPTWRAKITMIEESKDLTSLSLDKLIRNLKVYEMIIKKDSKIVKAKGERKSLALKDKKESNDEECSTSRSEDEEYAMAVRDFKKFFKRRENVQTHRKTRTKEHSSEALGSWSDSGEEDDEKAKDVNMSSVAQASNGDYILTTICRIHQRKSGVSLPASPKTHKDSDNQYGVSVPALTKNHKGPMIKTPYLEKTNTPY